MENPNAYPGVPIESHFRFDRTDEHSQEMCALMLLKNILNDFKSTIDVELTDCSGLSLEFNYLTSRVSDYIMRKNHFDDMPNMEHVAGVIALMVENKVGNVLAQFNLLRKTDESNGYYIITYKMNSSSINPGSIHIQFPPYEGAGTQIYYSDPERKEDTNDSDWNFISRFVRFAHQTTEYFIGKKVRIVDTDSPITKLCKEENKNDK